MNKKKILIAFIIIIFIVLIVNFIYNKFKKTDIVHNVLSKHMIFLETNYNCPISPNKLPESLDNIEYTYTFWLFIPNIPENGNWDIKYEEPKVILYRYGSPNIYYRPIDHILDISTTYKNESGLYDNYNFEIEDLDMQLWNNIVVTLKNRDFNVFVNGKLTKSTILENVPIIFHRYMFIGQKNNNMNGYISNLEYINKALEIKEVEKLYHSQKNNLPEDLTPYSAHYYKKRVEYLKNKEAENERNKELNFRLGM